MHLQIARGGAKPKMIAAASDLPITVGHARKSGMYEQAKHVIARRVELPEWLSDAVKQGGDSLQTVLSAKYPTVEIGESRGHIFMRPPRHLFECPAVGIDMEVYEVLQDDPSIEAIRFYVYATGYALVGIWTISAEKFIEEAKFVQTKLCFMPQMMVPLTALASHRVINIR